MSRSGIAGSYCGSICYFLRSLNTVFCAGCLSLLSHWECMKVPFSPYPCKHLLVTVFFVLFCFVFDGGSSDRCDRVLHCDFDVHFSQGWWCWVPFGHLCVFFFGEVAVSVLCLFCFLVLLLRCMSISINHWERLCFIILSLRKGLSLCYWIWISILFSQKLKNTKGSCVWLR